MARCVVLGTSKFTASLIYGIIDSLNEVSCVISMPDSSKPDNSYDLKKICVQFGIKYYEFEDINSVEAITLIKKIDPNFIISSWPKIIKNEILSLAYVIGTHPTNLPKDRGRHPLHWNIIRGIKKSKLSFFKMDKNVDSGNLLLQLKYTISEYDDINSLNHKIEKLAKTGINKLLSHDKIKEIAQSGNTNYLRARNIHDCLIDPRMDYKTINRIVRSFTSPYPCAKLIVENQILNIKKCCLIKQRDKLGYGKILKESTNFIIFQCSDSVIKLSLANGSKYSYIGGGWIQTPSFYIQKYSIKL
ncbi:formyltransferase family protein [Campylobacter fetus]|uniref:formyltransferase family protein n=1 Tax=Campylobacter fetus TaxID=196 RepID=UPI0003C270F2|nr:formyltransferase family protein [Campylobacter fetus]AGZ82398.1 formyltransferase domain-containing protein [Campylobacter fetus subsp. testudinum 03-427]ALV65567.1 formyltransferase domain-containing protein [Campylobacter fetus subsp. testudinum Sp3]EAI4322699.1 hypothetical protein [Campylobacter fetus]MPB72200.1 hypothetical protein [Campylobacter fetus]MPB78050.1 hypothetical protein [Campylobacter fetus]